MDRESPVYPCLIILLHSNSEGLDKFVSIFERVPGSSELLRLRNLPFQVLGDKRDFVFLNFQSPQEEGEEEAEVDFDRKRFFNSAAFAAFAASASAAPSFENANGNGVAIFKTRPHTNAISVFASFYGLAR